MGEALTPTGPDGMTALSLPLPISAGRGYAPSLTLNYNSGAGNSPFGLGWDCNVMAVRRRTHFGVPHYNETDTFLGPEGEVLVMVDHPRDESALQDINLGSTFTVTGYRSRLESHFSRLEYWQPKTTHTTDFWLIYSPDGQVHLLGKNPQARISNPSETTQTAQWLLEASVSPHGEQIYYQYRTENEAGCETDEITTHPQATAQRYLHTVHYGNLTASETLPGLDGHIPSQASWLFCLVFDYGERNNDLQTSPAFTTTNNWLCRQDCFSRYEYGFELRTRRLCRQILMYHRLQTLTGQTKELNELTLVSRLILDYDESAIASTLVSVRKVGHEQDGTAVTLPPLEFAYQDFSPQHNARWQPMDVLENFNAIQRWQLIDLKGEGLPGLLYQDKGAWWYRAAQRQTGSDQDAVTWEKMQPLSVIPTLQNNASLVDINGDGQLDWVITGPGLRGYHSQRPDGSWTRFTPLNALPVEYFHPRAQLADLMGAGLSDLVLIGPKSVRLYANTRDGFTKGQDVVQSGNVTLPVPGADARKLVAFSDVLGSGQAHLVEVSATKVTCWPNLGHGRFGQPITLLGFSQPETEFNPAQVYLADLDGSGPTDLIYVHTNRLDIFLNKSGNSFAAPVTLTFPDGLRFDNTCQLQVADIQGQGVASLILSVPHMAPHHWRCDLTLHKPWLLSEMNNNMGANHTLRYRSSAQFWLDEKAKARASGQTPVCYLPFPVHTLWQTETEDEISGNKLVTTIRYVHGAWDGHEREFRGFGYVEQTDSHQLAQGNAPERTPPALTKNWYATGLPEIDNALSAEYWRDDTQAFNGFTPRFTAWTNNKDVLLTPEDDNTRYWLYRALKGQPLRSELYGLDGSALEPIPYTVTEFRPQVRRLQNTDSQYPVLWSSVAESRSYHYERIASDPQCSQDITLSSDLFGQPLKRISVQYPRRNQPATSPYLDILPDTLFASSYDDQQHKLRLTYQQFSWHHLTSNAVRMLGLSDGTRSDIFTYDAEHLPVGGLNLEILCAENSLIAHDKPREYLGQQKTFYTDGQNVTPLPIPTRQALIAFTETTVFNQSTLSAFDGSISSDKLSTTLEQAGYQQADYLFPRTGEGKVWTARHGYTDYGTATQFCRPLKQSNTQLTGKITLTWDATYCVVIQTRNAAGLATSAKYDWRFLTPVQLTDINDNVHLITLDALGRPITQRFWGTENGVMTGYTSPEKTEFLPPTNVNAAIDLTGMLPVAQCQVYAPESWMPVLSQRTLNTLSAQEQQMLQNSRIITEEGRICILAHRRWLQSRSVPTQPVNLLSSTRLPPHSLTLTTDRYGYDTAQQIRQQVTFSDGFGRLLQAAVRHEAGKAWQRNKEGSLVTKIEDTDNRWAVTGRTEYDNKGQPIRTYQPYFLNDWRYVSDSSTRKEAYADTHIYDPVGREVKVITAKGWFRRTLFTPWFTVNEDENDTAAEVKM